MPNVCGYSWSNSLDDLIILKSRQYGVPLDLSYAIIAAESGFNPTALGDAGCSSGLLQLNTCGGQGTGYTVQQLYDPVLNLDIGLPPIGVAFRTCWSAEIPQDQFIRCVMRNSGHPGNVPDGNPTFEAAFSAIWPAWTCFFNNLVTLTSGNPIISGGSGSLSGPPYPSPVIAPFQPGQPVVVENPPFTGMSAIVPLAIGALAGVAILSMTRGKKIIIKNIL